MASAKRTLLSQVGRLVLIGAQLLVLYYASIHAFRIRMFAIDNYGRLIHECAPSRAGCGDQRGASTT